MWDARLDVGPYGGIAHPEAVERFLEQNRIAQSDLGIAPLGSGSDFTPFLQRLGVSDICKESTACERGLIL